MSERYRRRFSIFERHVSSEPSTKTDIRVTWNGDSKDTGMRDNGYKEVFKDLLLIAAPFITSYIGYELGGIIGTGVGAAIGLACDMYYLYRYY